MLEHKVSIQIVKGKVNSKFVRMNVIKLFCLVYGGASCIDILGAWQDSKGNIITDSSWLVYAYCSEFNAMDIVDLARSVSIQLKQDSVMIELDNKIYFVNKEGLQE